MKGAIHFREDDLLELYAERSGTDAPPHPHLVRCSSCAARYDALVRALEQHADEVRDEADAFFTTDRLSRQCERILNRLQHVTQFARIIPFPARSADGLSMLHRGPMAGLVSRRWVAAAAAAGLMLGFFAERAIQDPRMLQMNSGRGGRSIAADLNPAAGQAVPHLISYEDSILDEIDDMIGRSAIPGLAALDDLTPRAQNLPPELR